MREDGASENPAATTLKSGAGRDQLIEVLTTLVHARSSREQMRVALRPLCAQAYRERLDVAEFVKLLKGSFTESGITRALAHAGERQQVLDRVISVCIDEYYTAE